MNKRHKNFDDIDMDTIVKVKKIVNGKERYVCYCYDCGEPYDKCCCYRYESGKTYTQHCYDLYGFVRTI